jgi:hypothetical protein
MLAMIFDIPLEPLSSILAIELRRLKPLNAPLWMATPSTLILSSPGGFDLESVFVDMTEGD